jgi:hypothetical protein
MEIIKWKKSQDGHHSFQDVSFSHCVSVLDHIDVNDVVEDFPLELPIPFESLVGGIKDHLSPPIVDDDFEIGHLVSDLLRDEEVVVLPVEYKVTFVAI